MMIEKYLYKIWKNLTKRFVHSPAHRASIFRMVDPPKRSSRTREKQHHPYKLPKKIITFTGFYTSGSSVLSALFREFDNVEVLGRNEPLFEKKSVQKNISETHFFFGSKFLEMVDSFQHESASVRDQYIKHFIDKTNLAYTDKQTCPIECEPDLYNDYFKQICRKFLFTTLELDADTYRFMQDKEFPSVTSQEVIDLYGSCNFLKKQKRGSYLFYDFKKQPQETFAAAVTEFLESFFSILGTSDCVTYDQLLRHDHLERVNQYLPHHPIKQIAVWRDPRDQFLSSMRTDFIKMPRQMDLFEEFYRNMKHLHHEPFCRGLEYMLQHPYPHRLLIRFEDIVLKYDETVAKILKFLDIDPSHHIAPKTIFDPSISVYNIGAYRYYADQETMKEIERRLGEYCYDPEKENLTAEAWSLLRSTGHWD